MSTILVDKLLETVVVRGASDLHIAVVQPPVLHLHGLVLVTGPTVSGKSTTSAL